MKKTTIGMSVQGASHIVHQIPCQDANKIKIRKDGIVIAAVADGHGSKKCRYSDMGANLATEVFIDIIDNLVEETKQDEEKLIQLLRQSKSQDVIEEICTIWKERIHEDFLQREEEEFTEELYGTTLLGILVTDQFVFAMQIGDGDIVFVNETGVHRVIEPMKFLGTETYSMSSVRPWSQAIAYFQRLEMAKKSPCMFLLSTDGFINSFINDHEYEVSCNDYFHTLQEYGAKAVQENLYDWLTETSKSGCGDDITLVGIAAIPRKRNIK